MLPSHSIVGNHPSASTDEDMVDILRNSSGVAIPGGLMYLPIFPRAKDFQVVRGTELHIRSPLLFVSYEDE